MTKPPLKRLRSLVEISDISDQLQEEAAKKGLPLATYLRMLIITHQDRQPPATNVSKPRAK